MARAANSTGTEAVYVTDIVVTLYSFADTGLISLTDGTNTHFSWLCKDGNGSHFAVHFNQPFYWGQNVAINLINGTANVKAKLVVLGYVNMKA